MGPIVSEGGDAYRDLTMRSDVATRRFTVYVAFPHDEADWSTSVPAMIRLIDKNRADVEELDIDAVTERHARELAALALPRDYEPGGVILSVEERHGLYL